MTEIYVSTDVEADGPIPGPNSMLSFGSAAYTGDKNLLGTFTANLLTLPGAAADLETMKWWKTQPDAWAECRLDPQHPAIVMPRYVSWLKSLPGIPVFVAYPATYDFMFVYWYLIRFAGESPFSFSALDIKSYAMAVLGTDYRHTTKKSMPKHWFDPLPHTHKALDDAIGQGALFCNILAAKKYPLGVVLSVLILIYLTSHPEGAILGQLPGTEAYRDVRRHPEARTFPGLLIWRVGDDLFFASIGRMETALKNALVEVRPPVKHVLLDMSPVSYIDVSACDELITFIKELKSRDVTIAFARVRDAVRENLQLSKIEAVVNPADFHERVTDGIFAWQRREASHGIPSSHGPDQLKC